MGVQHFTFSETLISGTQYIIKIESNIVPLGSLIEKLIFSVENSTILDLKGVNVVDFSNWNNTNKRFDDKYLIGGDFEFLRSDYSHLDETDFEVTGTIELSFIQSTGVDVDLAGIIAFSTRSKSQRSSGN